MARWGSLELSDIPVKIFRGSDTRLRLCRRASLLMRRQEKNPVRKIPHGVYHLRCGPQGEEVNGFTASWVTRAPLAAVGGIGPWRADSS